MLFAASFETSCPADKQGMRAWQEAASNPPNAAHANLQRNEDNVMTIITGKV